VIENKKIENKNMLENERGRSVSEMIENILIVFFFFLNSGKYSAICFSGTEYRA